MDIKGKGKYIGKKKIELEDDLNLPIDTEIFFTIEDIKTIDSKKQKSEPLENCFAGLVDDSIDLEDEIRTVRKEIQQSLEKKIKNWNT